MWGTHTKRSLYERCLTDAPEMFEKEYSPLSQDWGAICPLLNVVYWVGFAFLSDSNLQVKTNNSCIGLYPAAGQRVNMMMACISCPTVASCQLIELRCFLRVDRNRDSAPCIWLSTTGRYAYQLTRKDMPKNQSGGSEDNYLGVTMAIYDSFFRLDETAWTVPDRVYWFIPAGFELPLG